MSEQDPKVWARANRQEANSKLNSSDFSDIVELFKLFAQWRDEFLARSTSHAGLELVTDKSDKGPREGAGRKRGIKRAIMDGEK